jgi:aspartokinase/homoserine dehydrogenase 1
VDVARKMLILMREAGINLNYEDIQIQPLLTDKIARADRVDSFLEMLPEMDAYYDGLVSAAASRGKVLRYVASIRPDSAVLRLKEYSPDSPFYNLNGTDNLVMFSTARYSSNPLVIRGPGAGAEVTAGGVFADILKTAHSYL